MKSVFVINPNAGQGKNTDGIVDKIKKATSDGTTEYEIYITQYAGDGERFVREYCRINGAARFFACGGDGTFGEILNGVSDCPDAEIGIIPNGTGNDFCRNFDCDFTDISAQLWGDAVYCDAIRYTTMGESRLCANMFNIGFDCNVADMTAKMKKKPFVSGSLAYLLSIFAMLIKKKGADITVELDGEEKHRGRLLLTSVANGTCCGGGIKSNPQAIVCDGYMDVNIIFNISRLNFLSKLPFYMKGTHVKIKGIEKIIYAQKCKRAVITPAGGRMRLCVDGEICDSARCEFEIVPGAFKFVVPQRLGVGQKKDMLECSV